MTVKMYPDDSNLSEAEKWAIIDSRRFAAIENIRWQVDRQRDWRDMADPRFDPAELMQLLEYIQEWRDIRQRYTNPDEVIFPAPPE